VHKIPNSGWVEAITGSMYCGKSEELIRRVRRAEIARQKVQVFKPLIDDRYQCDRVTSHDGNRVQAVPIDDPQELLELLDEDTDVVAIDEVQFFNEELPGVCEALADRGLRVIVAGLDRDFRGEPFGPVPQILALAEFVEKLHAICMQCSNPASRTQRLINGVPAAYTDPIILVGAQEVYEARCRSCHEVRRGEDNKEQE